ncbi:hypothetical protein ACSBPH_04175 [Microbacterium sp. F51-2R]|uniref:hypothetical protein n=1 Tax=Microbacterium sp. F51-2R TaxID=3445777 RepID=UPI003FA10282
MTEPSLDPTLLALLSIFGGAALTIIAGFVGAWIQSRREHQKWLREQRYLAYLDYIKKKDKYDRAAGRIEHTEGVFEQASRGLPPGFASDDEILAAIQDLAEVGEGPEEVRARIRAQRAEFEALYADMYEAVAAFSLLGPQSVVEAGRELTRADASDRSSKLNALETAMRDALAISM